MKKCYVSVDTQSRRVEGTNEVCYVWVFQFQQIQGCVMCGFLVCSCDPVFMCVAYMPLSDHEMGIPVQMFNKL